jgi:hypothetical protein
VEWREGKRVIENIGRVSRRGDRAAIGKSPVMMFLDIKKL